MGMFDYVKCEVPLPLTADHEELRKYDFAEASFQTKDLEQTLSTYIIRKDGTLAVNRYNAEYVEGDSPDAQIAKQWVEDVPRTITIRFYSYIYQDENKNDYEIEFEAVFEKGKLISLTNSKFVATDNTQRKARTLQMSIELQKREQLRQRWYMKYLYLPYVEMVRRVFRFYRRLKMYLISSHTIESWLIPW